MSDLKEIILLIEVHQEIFPSHGFDCACMDKYIQSVRKMLKSDDNNSQNRIDYVVRTALNR